jgi:hypothetical protein
MTGVTLVMCVCVRRHCKQSPLVHDKRSPTYDQRPEACGRSSSLALTAPADCPARFARVARLRPAWFAGRTSVHFRSVGTLGGRSVFGFGLVSSRIVVASSSLVSHGDTEGDGSVLVRRVWGGPVGAKRESACWWTGEKTILILLPPSVSGLRPPGYQKVRRQVTNKGCSGRYGGGRGGGILGCA